MAEILNELPDFFTALLNEHYGEEVSGEIINGLSLKRTVSLRINPLKGSKDATLKELTESGFDLKPVSWYEDAYQVPNAKEADLEATSAYKDGRIYLQSLSSMLPPLVLDPQPGKDILDMAAAPGGKTTQMAALTQNKCRITACELNPIRAERLRYNAAKQGASCVYVMQTDSRRLDSAFAFDSVLLDAPCSGSGTLTIGAETEGRFTKELVDKSVSSQKALLAKALELLKVGQEMVYSTCSVIPAENEDIISWALESPSVELSIIDESQFEGVPLLKSEIPGTLLVCPSADYEGFFAARLKKVGEVKLCVPKSGKNNRRKSGKRR